MFYSIAIAIIKINNATESHIIRFIPKDLRHLMRRYNRQQHWDHNDNSRAATMKLEREKRIVSTNRKLSMDANRFVLSCIPMHAHSTRILRPKRAYGITVQRISRIYVARMQILTSRCVPDGFSTIFFFSPYDNVHVSTCVKLLIVLRGPSPQCRISVDRFEKGSRVTRSRPDTNDPIRQCIFQNAWVIGILVICRKKNRILENFIYSIKLNLCLNYYSVYLISQTIRVPSFYHIERLKIKRKWITQVYSSHSRVTFQQIIWIKA